MATSAASAYKHAHDQAAAHPVMMPKAVNGTLELVCLCATVVLVVLKKCADLERDRPQSPQAIT